MLRLLFRKQNSLLFMAAGINLSILFAPLAYAANYTSNVYTWLYGSWITVERTDPLGGSANYTHITTTGDWMLFLFAVLCGALTLVLASMIFVNRRPALKKRLLLLALAGLLVQGLLAWRMEYHLLSYLGRGEIETRLQAQFWLLLFPPLFTWWAWRSVSKRKAKEEKASNPD